MAKINTDFSKEIKKYGGFDLNACYNCGNCTAICSLSTEEDSFPREMVRFSVLGLEDNVKSSLKPWLCYYCGECSSACPREANPGELMMSLRRWLTAKYDWTGLSGRILTSLKTSLTSLILVGIGVLMFCINMNFDLEIIMYYGHSFEMIAITSVFAIILLPNLFRMWWYIIHKPKLKVPFSAYIKSIKDLFIHMFTQKRALGCDGNNIRWFKHFILVIGYLSLIFTTVFLNWFSSQNLFIIILGYVESAIIFIITVDFVYGRIRKKSEVNKKSQPSDWFFVIWLLLMGLTAFIVRVFIDVNILEENVWMYIVHITILAQWALIIVPFGKWTHFLYRSFAMFLYANKEIGDK